MNATLISLLTLFFLVGLLAAGIVGISALIGRRRAPDGRYQSYECGLDRASPPRKRFPIKFFVTAVLFIVFDVEILLILPWAVSFREAVAEGLGLAVFLEAAIFLALLGVALAYAWGIGALKWEE